MGTLCKYNKPVATFFKCNEQERHHIQLQSRVWQTRKFHQQRSVNTHFSQTLVLLLLLSVLTYH